jgi:hypothetical protein
MTWRPNKKCKLRVVFQVSDSERSTRSMINHVFLIVINLYVISWKWLFCACLLATRLLVSHTTYKLYQFARQLSVEFCCRYDALLTVQCFRHELILIKWWMSSWSGEKAELCNYGSRAFAEALHFIANSWVLPVIQSSLVACLFIILIILSVFLCLFIISVHYIVNKSLRWTTQFSSVFRYWTAVSNNDHIWSVLLKYFNVLSLVTAACLILSYNFH